VVAVISDARSRLFATTPPPDQFERRETHAGIAIMSVSSSPENLIAYDHLSSLIKLCAQLHVARHHELKASSHHFSATSILVAKRHKALHAGVGGGGAESAERLRPITAWSAMRSRSF